MKQIHIIIDGVNVSAYEGQSVLQAALNANIYIPHLCHHPDLPDIGVCGLCLVETGGKLVSSCTLPTVEGMEVCTKSEQIEKRRRLAMKLLLAAHPEDCSTCPKYGNCELQTLMQYLGVSPEGLNRRVKQMKSWVDNPLFEHDMTRCILCGRCLRACQKIRGVGAISYQRDKSEWYIGTPASKLLMDAGCRFCGACVEVCPTGALRDKREQNNPNGYRVPCRETCPSNVDIPKYIRLVKEQRYAEASAVIREKLTFPKLLGFVCSHPCESACRRECLNEAVSICRLKLAAVERDKDKEWKARRKLLPDSGRKVAVVGGGPAGLTAAYYLRKQGHAVTVFETNKEAGGMLRYGIPAYRLPRNVVREDIADMTEVGLEIRCGVKITNFQALSEKYDAVVIAIGNHSGVRLPIPGNDLESVLVNLDFLKCAAEGNPPKLGERVLVLGGGNVAFDCARTAVRLGAKQVEMACLEDERQLPGDREELEAAREEGIRVHFSKSFVEIVGNGDGGVGGVKTLDVASMYFDGNRRLVLKTVENSEKIIEADTVIFATGQRADLDSGSGLVLGRGNSIVVDKDGKTNLERVFAAGDVIYGTSSVVKAIAAGRAVASSVDRFLGGDGNISEKLADIEKPDGYLGKLAGFAEAPRVRAEWLPTDIRRTNFDRVERSFHCTEACAEAGRCLQCDLREQFSVPKTWNDFEEKAGENNG